MTEFCVDEIQAVPEGTGTRITLKGWVLLDAYTVAVYGDGRKLCELKPETARYDVCAAFHMPIEDNTYGIDAGTVLPGTYRTIEFHAVTEGEDILIGSWTPAHQPTVKDRAVSALRNVKRGVRWAWQEYHFLVPPKILAEKLRSEKRRQADEAPRTVFDPADPGEYAAWLKGETYPKESGKADLVFVTEREIRDTHGYPQLIMTKLDLAQINARLVCFAGKDTELYEPFFAFLKECEGYDLITFDSDRKDADGRRCRPAMKPDFSPDTLLGVNYIGNVFVIRKELLEPFDGKEIDRYAILLALRNRKMKTRHISKVLFADNTEEHPGETLRAYEETCGIHALREEKDGYVLTHMKAEETPLISIIIPTRDLAEDLETCISSVFAKTSYPNFEILILDNNSEKEETFRYFEKVQKEHDNVRVIEMKMPFNYSRLNNLAVRDHAKGEYIVLLNNDTELISGNWLEEMLGWASLETTGTVGIRLLFADDTIQHAGILMGKGGIAGHAHHGEDNTDGYYYDLKIPYNVTGNTAACLMVKKDRFLEAGMMDEELQVAFNDVDLNLKLLERGYRNVFLPHVSMHHYESKSRGNDIAGEKLKRYMNECIKVREKWQRYVDHDPYYSSAYSLENDYHLKRD